MGAVLFEVQSDIAGFQNKAGSLSFVLMFFAFGGLSTSQTVTREWPLLWAEYHQGLYGAVAYAVTRLLLELTLLRVLPAVAFGAIFYPMMGLRKEVAPFMRFLFASALASADSALLCTAIAACAPTKAGATALVATIALLICVLLNGFNLNLTALPGWIEWLAWCSFARHAFEIMLCSELENTMVDFAVPDAPPVRLQANVILTIFGLDAGRYSQAFGALIWIGVSLVVLTALIVASKMKPLFQRAAGVVASQTQSPVPALRRQPLNATKPNAPSNVTRTADSELDLPKNGSKDDLSEATKVEAPLRDPKSTQKAPGPPPAGPAPAMEMERVSCGDIGGGSIASENDSIVGDLAEFSSTSEFSAARLSVFSRSTDVMDPEAATTADTTAAHRT